MTLADLSGEISKSVSPSPFLTVNGSVYNFRSKIMKKSLVIPDGDGITKIDRKPRP